MFVKEYYSNRCAEDNGFEAFFRDYVWCFCFDHIVVSASLTHLNELFFAEKICELIESYALGKANNIDAFEKLGLAHSMPYLVKPLFSILEENSDPHEYIDDNCNLNLMEMINTRLLYMSGDMSFKTVYKFNQWALYILRSFADFSRIYKIQR